jgi:DNA-nicking Smr family endonuclease
MKHVEIDLHGLRHSEVEAILANEFFWKNVKTAEVITGNSVKMKKIVKRWFNENNMNYVEYLHKASFLVNH